MNRTTQHLSSQKIEEALELLSEAAREEKGELLNLLAEKFGDLKAILFDGRSTISQRISETSHQAAEKIRTGKEHVREIADQAEQRVREKPWTYIGWAAVGGLIMGYFFAKRENPRQNP